MENSKIAKRLYDDKFRNEIIGITGVKETIYDDLRERYFPYIGLAAMPTDDPLTDRVTLKFHDVGAVVVNFRFEKNSGGLENMRLADVKHVATNIGKGTLNTERLKKSIIDQMFSKWILHTVCMKGMVHDTIKSKMFPYADITMQDISDTVSRVDVRFGEFPMLSFNFHFEQKSKYNYWLHKID